MFAIAKNPHMLLEKLSHKSLKRKGNKYKLLKPCQ